MTSAVNCSQISGREIVLLLRFAHHRFERALSMPLAKFGLTLVQYEFMATLAYFGVSLAEPQTLPISAEQLLELIDRGLVERRHYSAAKVTTLDITELGKGILAAADPILDAAVEQIIPKPNESDWLQRVADLSGNS
jgi:DNA-binding MarR family transcriptional regulator